MKTRWYLAMMVVATVTTAVRDGRTTTQSMHFDAACVSGNVLEMFWKCFCVKFSFGLNFEI